jgi:hypothetical protein
MPANALPDPQDSHAGKCAGPVQASSRIAVAQTVAMALGDCSGTASPSSSRTG